MASSNQGGNPDSQGGRKGGSQGWSTRGFASMDPERQREIASQGGKAAHESGNAHEFDSEEARAAGKKSHGGQASGSGGSGSGRGSGSSGSSGAAAGEGEGGSSGASRGGSSRQHAQAGRQSPKNGK